MKGWEADGTSHRQGGSRGFGVLSAASAVDAVAGMHVRGCPLDVWRCHCSPGDEETMSLVVLVEGDPHSYSGSKNRPNVWPFWKD
jgi:hypothetical protein